MPSRCIKFCFLLALCCGGLCLAEVQAGVDSRLDDLLERTGRGVEAFWQQISSFACMESVTQEKFGKNEKVEYRKDSIFDYLAIPKEEEDILNVEELRMLQKSKPDKSNKPAVLATNGFPTLLLIFHPRYRPDYQFQIEPESAGDGSLTRVGFEHIPGRFSTCALTLKDKIYPLDLKGTAWIDPQSGIIEKIAAGLVAPLKDINIKALNVEVIYQPQNFPPDAEAKWLPSTATIDVQTALQHWRNIHLFSQYKRFTVQSIESRSR